MTTDDSDLNELRKIIRRAQQNGTPYPDDPNQRIMVGRNGQIYTEAVPVDTPVSKVHHGTFASAEKARLAADLRFAASHMPPDTEYIDEPEVRGWLYDVTTELGGRYTLLAFFDGREYRVKLVAPELEGRIDEHDGHLYRDGTICLSDRPGAGQASLEEAYSKSVLWALGVDFVLHGYTFPFSA